MAGALRLEGSVRWPSSDNPANMLSANAGAKTTTLCAYHASCEHDGTKLIGGSFLRPPPNLGGPSDDHLPLAVWVKWHRGLRRPILGPWAMGRR